MTSELDLETALEDWMMDLRAGGAQPRTLVSYERTARQFMETCQSQSLDRPAIRAWMRSLSDKAPATQQLGLTVVRVFCKWMVKEDLLSADPTSGISAPTVKAVPVDPFTKREITALVKACQNQRDRAIIALLASSGIRLLECANLLTENLSMSQQQALILGKGAKWRTVPFDARAGQALARYLRGERRVSRYADNPYLFLSERGHLVRDSIDKMLRAAGRRAGIENVHAHRFRHTFADAWLSDGGSESALMAICGWESRAMLDRYTRARRTDRALDEYRRMRR
jgi:integrase/recombinase XerD